MTKAVHTNDVSPIWTQRLKGEALDLLRPKVTDIDFVEVAVTLSYIHRYGGAAEKPVSVALHTLIACDAAPMELRPWVLLHDAHEAFIGDVTTPTRRALAAIGGVNVAHAFAELENRLDRAIHQAAGLPLPSPEQFQAIRKADLCAMATERRDFLARPRKSWGHEVERTRPLAKVYRLRSAPDIAAALFLAFQSWLPALRRAPLTTATR